MQWLREGNNTVKIGKQTYGYGDEIPSGKVDKAVLDKWKEKGWVGSVPKPGAVAGKDKYEEKISGLEASNQTLVSEKQSLAEKNKALSDEIKSLEAKLAEGSKDLVPIADKQALEDKLKKLEDDLVKAASDNKSLADENAKLKKDGKK